MNKLKTVITGALFISISPLTVAANKFSIEYKLSAA